MTLHVGVYNGTMAMTMGGRRSGQAELNVTPLIDILLVLLIIFMVITPTKSEGLAAEIPREPEDQARNVVDERAVVVSIDKDRGLRINGEETGYERLGGRLREIFATRVDRTIFVKGHEDLEFQYVAAVMDVAKGAGVDRVGLIGRGIGGQY